MKKKLLALALIMIIAVGGVFAAPRGVPAVAKLYGEIGTAFQHGFTDNDGVKYQATLNLSDVFANDTVELVYGFKVLDSAKLRAEMGITPFTMVGGTKTIAISEVRVNDQVIEKISGTELYAVLAYEDSAVGGELVDEVTITIVPDLTGASPGEYISTITINIKADY